VFTRACQCSFSRARSIHSTPSHTIPLRYPSTLSFHLLLGFQIGLFPSSFLTRNPYVPHALPISSSLISFLLTCVTYIIIYYYVLSACIIHPSITYYQCLLGQTFYNSICDNLPKPLIIPDIHPQYSPVHFVKVMLQPLHANC
jgi:hypothetical protein